MRFVGKRLVFSALLGSLWTGPASAQLSNLWTPTYSGYAPTAVTGSTGSLAASSTSPRSLILETADPAGLPLSEGLTTYPGLDLSWGHDSNLFLTPTNETESNLAIVSPYVKVDSKAGPHMVDFLLRGDFGRYGGSTADNYADYQLLANGKFTWGLADLRLHGESIKGHDARGSTDRPLSNEPDVYKNTGVDGTFGFGGGTARARVELNGGFYARDYQNNRTITEASDRSTGYLGAAFLFRVGERISLLAEAEQRDIDYQMEASTLDSKETRWFVGARWEATAQTTGYAKVGRLSKDFGSNTRSDVNSSSAWDVGLRWSPGEYSAVDFSTARTTAETTGVGDAILSTRYGAAWTHNWSSYVQTMLLARRTEDDYQGASGAGREDSTNAYGGRISFQVRRWLRAGFELTHSERHSNTMAVEYRKNVYLFTLGATL